MVHAHVRAIMHLLTLVQEFRDSQIFIIMNFVVVSSVGIKRIVCICWFWYFYADWYILKIIFKGILLLNILNRF